MTEERSTYLKQGKASLWIRMGTIATILVLALQDSHRSQSGSPNLRPHKPDNWSAAIVVSSVQDTHVDSIELSDSDTLYVDFAVINSGGSSVTESFQINLFVDGQLWQTFSSNRSSTSPLMPNYYTYWEDYPIGSLSAGRHTLKIVADAANSISESNERDNEHTKTIIVVSSLPDLAPHRPSGWSAPIVVSTRTDTNLDSDTLTTTDGLYLDWAAINRGTSVTASSFQVRLLVDGRQRQSWTVDSGLMPDYYKYVEDFSLGTLSTGRHTVSMVVDATNSIEESDERNNRFDKTINVTTPPNLTPTRPADWSDEIVVSKVRNTHIDSSELGVSDRLYVDFAVINSGASPVTAHFQVNLFIDGRLEQSFNSRDFRFPLNLRHYVFWEDHPIGSLSAGRHTLKIVADPENLISESNESDNEYTKTINVADTGACFPLTTNVSPQGAGTITSSQAPNCGETTVAISAPTNYDDGPRPQPREPVLAVQSATESHGERAFAALTAKAQAKGQVRVIVGLRTDDRTGESATSSISDTAPRLTRIARVQQSFLTKVSGLNISSIKKFKYIPFIAMEVDAAALETLASGLEVASIEEDKLLKPMLQESTTLIGAPQAWGQGFSGSGQTIAILDTGIDKNHPFLKGKVVSEACYSGSGPGESLCPGGVAESTSPGSGMPCSDEDLPFGVCFHGTHVAGIAGGKGNEFSGVARDATLISIQIFSKLEASQCLDEGEGMESDKPCARTSFRDVISGLERVRDLSDRFDIPAVNLSIGLDAFPGSCDLIFPAVKHAIDDLRSEGIVTIVSSGNEKSTVGIGVPACISSAVSVGSTDDGSSSPDGRSETTKDHVSDFSNSSPALDLLAPGRWITSSIPFEDSFFPLPGTSMAAPHVAGAWAVLKSKAADASVEQVLSVLKQTGVPITDPRNNVTTPRIQVDAALNALKPQISYTSGTSLTLTATPNPGFRFKSWTGCDSVSGDRCTVGMDSARRVSVLFEPVQTEEPDLLITSLTGPSMATIGSEASVATEILNQGSLAAGPFQLGFYLLTLDLANIFPLASCEYDSGLEVGGSSRCSGSVPLPGSISPGTYLLASFVDVTDQVTESDEDNNARLADSGLLTVLAPTTTSRIFVPVVLSAAGRNNSFFTSEMTLTNRGTEEATLHYTYTADAGGGSGTATDTLAPGQQRIQPDAIRYLTGLGIPIPSSGNRIGTLSVEVSGSSEVSVTTRTTTAVPDGRAGLSYLGIAQDEGFQEAVYLCGLRENRQDRSNVAFQHMGAPDESPITLRTTVYSGEADDTSPRVVGEVELQPGGFHQYSGLLGRLGTPAQGYVKVEKIEGEAPFYTYGVINDNFNSDGSFVFPLTQSSLVGTSGQTLPVIIETGTFQSELTVTNFSASEKTVKFSFVAEAVENGDDTATFSLRLKAGEQTILPDIVEELRWREVAGIGRANRAYVGALFATPAEGDMSGIVIGARTGAPDQRGGQYSLFYNGVPYGSASVESAWIYGLQQNAENRSNLALVNTGEIDDSSSTFEITIYDGSGESRPRTRSVTLGPRRWKQENGILDSITQGYVQVRKTSGNNPFITYGVINDGGRPGERSGDGAFLPAQE